MDPKFIQVFFFIAFGILIFWALRSFNLWYWKIDENIENQKKIINLLEQIKNEKNT